MSKFVAGLFRLFMPCAAPADAGGGSGGGSGAGAGTGGGQGAGAGAAGGGQPGQGASGGQGGGQGAGATNPTALTDDTMILVDGKPVRYGDHLRGQRENWQRDYQNTFSTNLRSALQRLSAASGGKPGQGQPGQGGGGPQRPNINELLSKVSNMPFVDGATLKELADNGLMPLAQTVNHQQTLLQNLVKVVKELQGGHRTTAEKEAVANFDTVRAEAVKGLGLEHVDPNDEFIKDFALDVYHGFTWKPGELEKEFPKLFKARYDAAVKHIRAVDQARLDKRKKEPFKFPDATKGDSTPTGKEHGKKPMSNRELADAIFAHSEGARA